MKYLALSSLFVTLVLLVNGSGRAGDDAAEKKALKQIEGTYALIAGEQDGETVAADQLKNAKLTIKGNKHLVQIGDIVIKGTHKLDAAKKPHEIDATDTEGPYKGHTVLGIYKMKGDEFILCIAAPGKDRPKEFTTKSGTGHVYHTWKKTAAKAK